MNLNLIGNATEFPHFLTITQDEWRLCLSQKSLGITCDLFFQYISVISIIWLYPYWSATQLHQLPCNVEAVCFGWAHTVAVSDSGPMSKRLFMFTWRGGQEGLVKHRVAGSVINHNYRVVYWPAVGLCMCFCECRSVFNVPTRCCSACLCEVS